MLYSNRRESPLDDQDPWFSQMLAKIDHWMATTPKNDDGSGLNVKWFVGMLIFQSAILLTMTSTGFKGDETP